MATAAKDADAAATDAPDEVTEPDEGKTDEPQDAAAVDEVDTEHGEALAVPEPHDGSILTPARYGFDPKQIEAIRRTVAKECSAEEFVMFLEVCARTQLDPFQKQIFAAKIKGAIQIIVSRDGLLANAYRIGDLERFTGDVVRAGDEFKVVYKDGERTIEHSYGLDAAFQEAAFAPSDGDNKPAIDFDLWRGPIVGAWCELKRKGHAPTFFLAPLSEYRREGNNPWGTHPSAMILKVAEVYALRKAYTISGVLGEEEAASVPALTQNLTEVPRPNYGDDALGLELESLVDEANELEPGSYRPAKVKQLVAADREALAVELREFVAEHRPAAEVIEDAEVVPDPA